MDRRYQKICTFCIVYCRAGLRLRAIFHTLTFLCPPSFPFLSLVRFSFPNKFLCCSIFFDMLYVFSVFPSILSANYILYINCANESVKLSILYWDCTYFFLIFFLLHQLRIINAVPVSVDIKWSNPPSTQWLIHASQVFILKFCLTNIESILLRFIMHLQKPLGIIREDWL